MINQMLAKLEKTNSEHKSNLPSTNQNTGGSTTTPPSPPPPPPPKPEPKPEPKPQPAPAQNPPPSSGNTGTTSNPPSSNSRSNYDYSGFNFDRNDPSPPTFAPAGTPQEPQTNNIPSGNNEQPQ